MLEKISNSRFLIVFAIPFIIGALGVLGFAPFNFTLINFIIIPSFFFLISFVNKRSKSTYRKKPYLRNLFFIGYFLYSSVIFSKTGIIKLFSVSNRVIFRTEVFSTKKISKLPFTQLLNVGGL